MIWSDKHDVPVKTALVLFTPGLAATNSVNVSFECGYYDVQI